MMERDIPELSSLRAPPPRRQSPSRGTVWLLVLWHLAALAWLLGLYWALGPRAHPVSWFRIHVFASLALFVYVQLGLGALLILTWISLGGAPGFAHRPMVAVVLVYALYVLSVRLGGEWSATAGQVASLVGVPSGLIAVMIWIVWRAHWQRQDALGESRTAT